MTTYESASPSAQPGTAIVTGASRSIGRAIARRLGRAGHPVVVNYLRGETEAEAVVREISQSGGRALAVRADVASATGMSGLFDHAEEHFGPVQVLVNNAGVSRLGALAEAGDRDYELIFDVNVRGTLNGLRAAADGMRRGGRIVNLSSTALATATPGMGLYLAAKAAVETLTRTAAKEFAPRGITVNAVAPGLVRSEMFFEGKTAEQIDRIERAAPAGRLGEVEEIASAVALLTSPEATWISGQVVRVNGAVA